MTTSIEDVQKIIAQLDSGTDEHWTDDGAPSLDAVRTLGNDTSITRDQINKAAPGFSRAGSNEEDAEGEKIVEKQAADFQTKTAAAQGKVVAARDPGAPPPRDEGAIDHDDAYNLDLKDPLSDAPTLPQAKLKEIMERRVAISKDRLDKAREAITHAQDYANKVEAFYNQNVAALQRAFPPMHPMDAIKAHLKAQMEHRAQMAGRPDLYHTGPVPASPLDARLGIKGERNVRGIR